jgi:hypothetical protein
MTSVDIYRTHSPWSDPGRFTPILATVPPDPAAIVQTVSGLLMHPFFAAERGLPVPEPATDDREVHGVASMLARVLARSHEALAVARPMSERFFCVCAGYALLATAVFRTHGIPARCRVGFAAYFTADTLVDHWLCEYWDGGSWWLLDAELDDRTRADHGIAFSPTDVPRALFLDASTAWRRLRMGEIDPAKIGLPDMGLRGAWFVAHSVLRDAAALNKIELLPWETWSIGREFGPGREPSEDHTRALDAVAAELCGTPDAARAERVCREHAWLQVTPTVLSFARGALVEVGIEPEVG